MRPAILILPILTVLLGGCDADNGRLPGYVEGEYVRVAAPSSGRLQALRVREGDRLTAGALLFTLESEPEQAAVEAASARLQQSQAQLADLDKGQRRDELAVLEAQLAATRASEALAHRDLLRQQQLARQGVVSVATLDSYRARWQLEQGNRQALDAQLRVARLAARDDQRQAAQQAVAAAQAELDQQRWQLQQKQQRSQQSARVEQILYRPGEWVPAGAPVLSLLPEHGVKARFYLPEASRPQLQVGQTVTLYCDGCKQPIPARVSYIANQVEFTPPVIYSQENRARLVFLVEARPEPDHPGLLHPGQPLEVAIGAQP